MNRLDARSTSKSIEGHTVDRELDARRKYVSAPVPVFKIVFKLVVNEFQNRIAFK
jgi:hypothetical protein